MIQSPVGLDGAEMDRWPKAVSRVFSMARVVAGPLLAPAWKPSGPKKIRLPQMLTRIIVTDLPPALTASQLQEQWRMDLSAARTGGLVFSLPRAARVHASGDCLWPRRQ